MKKNLKKLAILSAALLTLAPAVGVSSSVDAAPHYRSQGINPTEEELNTPQPMTDIERREWKNGTFTPTAWQLQYEQEHHGKKAKVAKKHKKHVSKKRKARKSKKRVTKKRARKHAKKSNAPVGKRLTALRRHGIVDLSKYYTVKQVKSWTPKQRNYRLGKYNWMDEPNGGISICWKSNGVFSSYK